MLKFNKKKHIFSFITVLLLVFSISFIVYAYSSGVAGCTLKTHSTGCNCHSTTANTSVIVSLSGPDTVLTGSTNDFTFTVGSTGSFTRGGIDVAVSNGTLDIGTSTGIKILSGEVVQSSKFTGATTKTFTFTAPSTSGTVIMYACGSAGSSNPPPWNNASNKTIVVKSSTGIENNITPVSFSLNQNYPNPFNPNTTIKFQTKDLRLVTLKVYNIIGKEVATLVNENLKAGNYEVTFDGSNLSSGIYLYKIKAGNFSEVKKMTLVK